MKKVLLLALATILASCSSDSNDSPSSSFSSPGKLRKVSTVMNGTVTFTDTYYYEGNRVKQAEHYSSGTGYTVMENFLYTNGLLSSSTKSIDGYQTSITTYIYEGDYVVQTTTGGMGSIPDIITIYVRNSVGRITETTESQGGIINFHSLYEYNSQNNMTPQHYENLSTGEYNTVIIDYDTYKNPAFENYPETLLPQSLLSPNNIVSMVSPTYSFEATYEYNSSGYPIKRLGTTYANTTTTTTVTNFEYYP